MKILNPKNTYVKEGFVQVLFSMVLVLLMLSSIAPAAKAERMLFTPYKVGVGDILDINVLQPDELKKTVVVAPDGSVAFPYIGTVHVLDRTVDQIQSEISRKLASGYMNYPVVTVTLLESHSQKFFVYGEVNKPGEYPLEKNATVLRAIAMSGGFTKFGSSSRVKILRVVQQGVGYQPIKIKISDVMNGSSHEDKLLKSGDIIVVSEGVF